MQPNSFTRTCKAIQSAVDHAKAGGNIAFKPFHAKAKAVPIITLGAVFNRLTRDELRVLARRFNVPRGENKAQLVDNLIRCGRTLNVSIW